MSAVVADTHVIVWYLQDSNKLSSSALLALEDAIENGESIYVSAISIVEITYLVEKSRLPAIALEQLLQSLRDPDVSLVVAPIDLAIAECLSQIPRETVPDMGDRIIAATALHLGLPLVTKDEKLRALTAIQTIWKNRT